jgi:hypothetical protein
MSDSPSNIRSIIGRHWQILFIISVIITTIVLGYIIYYFYGQPN